MSDASLWLRVQDDDGDALAVLFDRHVDTIYNFCYRRVGDWAAAEYLVSEVFIAAWRKRHNVKVAADGLRPWLLAVAFNVTRNHLRSTRRGRSLLDRLVRDGPMAPDPADDVIARVDGQAALVPMLHAMRTLPLPEQEVAALCLLGDMTPAEAAGALGISAPTARSRLMRARRRLTMPSSTPLQRRV